jgi:hypothetical protein
MIQLLRDLTADIEAPVGPGNPLRQVIINTHSPAVVMQVPEDSLIMAETIEINTGRVVFTAVQFRGLANTWRERPGEGQPISKGRLLSYLNPVGQPGPDSPAPTRPRRVIDREDIRQYKIPFSEIAG